MRTLTLGSATLALLATLAATSTASAATLQVGPGKTFTTPCAAIAAAMANDTIEVDAGTYTDTCSIGVAGLTLRGVGGRPKIDVSGGTPSGQKGIYVIDADDVTIENMELTGAHIDEGAGENGAGVRVEAGNFTIRSCFIHDNQDGILATPLTLSPLLTVEGNEFAGNALGNGCDDPGAGCTHSIYVSHNNDKVVFQYNWSHALASDTPDKGHLFKSRANQSFVLYNRLTGEGDRDSYAIDISNGGLAVIVGNMIEKPPMSGNGSSIAYAAEGLSNPDNRVFIVNNTFVNDKGGGTFLSINGGGVLTAHNNLFVGGGTPSSTGALSGDNLATDMPGFVDQAGYDYHLTAGSPAIDAGVDPGSADTFSLVPSEQYVHPAGHVARAAVGALDVGAFEFGNDPTGSGGAGGGSTSSGATHGATSSSDAAGSTGHGGSQGHGGSSGTKASGAGGSGDDDAAADDSGCSCTVVAPQRSPAALLAAIGLGLIALARRQRRIG